MTQNLGLYVRPDNGLLTLIGDVYIDKVTGNINGELNARGFELFRQDNDIITATLGTYETETAQIEDSGSDEAFSELEKAELTAEMSRKIEFSNNTIKNLSISFTKYVEPEKGDKGDRGYTGETGQDGRVVIVRDEDE